MSSAETAPPLDEPKVMSSPSKEVNAEIGGDSTEPSPGLSPSTWKPNVDAAEWKPTFATASGAPAAASAVARDGVAETAGESEREGETGRAEEAEVDKARNVCRGCGEHGACMV